MMAKLGVPEPWPQIDGVGDALDLRDASSDAGFGSLRIGDAGFAMLDSDRHASAMLEFESVGDDGVGSMHRRCWKYRRCRRCWIRLVMQRCIVQLRCQRPTH